MPKAKTAAATPQAYSKETDEMKMRKSLSKLADLSREVLAEADAKAIESLLHEVKRLWAIFGEHCSATDSVVIRREPTSIEKARRDVANDDFAKALVEFLSYTPKTMEGISLKASLLLRETALSENIEDHWEIFAKSLTEVPAGERISPKENAGRATSFETSQSPVVELIKVHRAAATALKTVPAEVDYDDDCPEWVAENEAFEALLSHVPVNFDEVCLLADYLRATDDLFERVMPASKTFWSWTLLNSLLSTGANATIHGPLESLSKTGSPVEKSSAKLLKSMRSLDQLPSDGPLHGETSAHPVIGNEPEEPLLVLIAEAFSQAEHNDAHRARAEGKDDVTKSIYFESGAKHENDRVMVLRDALSGIEARSASVAMAQITEAITKIDLIEAGSEDFPEHQKRELDRLLFSALRYVECLTGKTLEDIGLASMRYRNLDMWETVEARLNLIAENANG